MPKPNPQHQQKIMADFMATLKLAAGEVKRHFGNLKAKPAKPKDDTEELVEALQKRDNKLRNIFKR